MATVSRAEARVVVPPAYDPDLEAWGFKRDGELIVPATPCPDVAPEKIMREKRFQVDARLWEGRFERGRLKESRVSERLTKEAIHGRYTRLRESMRITEDAFSTGSWYGYGGAAESALTSDYTPVIPGPATRQQYWADYWATSAKAFEASTHSGIARRACRALVQFPYGRGVRWQITDDKARQAWEEFWKANNMRRRMRSILYDLAVYGEQFLRYFPAKRNDKGYLVIRQLDPATIYEVVTDQEDLEAVYFYHQQYQTRMEYFSPPAGNKAPEGRTVPGVVRYIIRQIDASEIDHWKVNDVAGEARGRSDLFPALGDLKRLRDLMTSKVVQTDIGNRVMAILKANGTGADINRLLSTIFPNGQPPAPGTIVGLNNASDLQPFQYNAGREVRADFTYDELIDGVCAGIGVPRTYLGLSPAQGSGATQASALTSVEPGVKAFQERQEICDEGLHQMFDRVMEAAGINGEVDREFVFPSIAKEDRSAFLQDLEISEANGWISKETAATAAAAELDEKDYDFDEEMAQIAKEFDSAADTDGKDGLGNDKPAQGGKIRSPLIRAVARQEYKLDPTKSQPPMDLPPGLAFTADGQPMQGGANGNGAPPALSNMPNTDRNGKPKPAGAGGIPGSRNPLAVSNTIGKRVAEADAHIRRTPADPEFLAHADEFERETAANLQQLLKDLELSAQ